MKYIIKKFGRVGTVEPIPCGILAEALTRKFSYYKQGYEYMPHPQWGIVKLYKEKTGRFPWGLLKGIVKIIIEKENEVSVQGLIIPDINYNRLKNLDPRLRYYQKDSILQLILNGGGTLSLPTGSGKSFTFLEYARYMDKKTLVIVPTLDLMSQWKKQIKNDKNITVLNYHKLQKNEDKTKLKEFNIVMFDESHKTAAKTVYNIMMATGNAINIGLTATPYREDGEELKIFAACGDIVHSIDRKRLTKEGYIANAEIKYVKLVNHNKSRFISYPDIYNEMIMDNKERNAKIVKIVENNLDKKILILISRIEHGEILKGLLDYKNIENIFIHGEVKDRTIHDKNRIVIATSIADEGINLPSFDVLILGVGGQSSVKLIQRIGRVLRPKPDGRKSIIYDFIDKSKYLIKHYKKRRSILEGEEFDIQEVDIYI